MSEIGKGGRRIMNAPASDLRALLRAMQPVRNPGVYVFASLPYGSDVRSLDPVELEPGSMSSWRYWHEVEDEFVYALEGEVTLITTESYAPGARLAEAILAFIAHVPGTREHESSDPVSRARHIANSAAAKAALAAGGLALPPGPLGWLTLLPELVTVWKVQAQMVADIAASFGKQAYLSREQMLYCLFRHTAAQAVRDLVVRVGERVLVHRVSVRAVQAVADKVGVRLTQHAIGRGVSRWVPVIGALGVGAYAYYDTGQVARTAIDLFEREIQIESPQEIEA